MDLKRWALFALLLGGLIALAILRSKTNLLRPLHPNGTASPLSKAISELIGIAGGIYLSLELVTTFLDISVPATIKVYGLGFNPLALLSMILAALQTIGISVSRLRRVRW
ncbi:MAG: hypothetical protein ACOY9Y_03665 [Bacillota bacterium]